MNRKIFLSAVAALGALGIATASTGRESREPQVDTAAVDRYIARLAAEAAPKKQLPVASGDAKLSKEQAGRVDRVEPMIGAALTTLK